MTPPAARPSRPRGGPEDGVRPKLLMICPDYKPNLGGEAELAYRVSLGLEEWGHELAVLAGRASGPVPEDAALEGPTIRRLPLDAFEPLSTIRGWLRWPGAMLGVLRELRRALSARSPDLCFVTTYMTWIYLGLRWFRAPYVLFLHGEDVTWMHARGGISLKLFLSACRGARWLFFNSEYSRQVLIESLPSAVTKSCAAGCGVDPTTEWTTARRDEARAALGWGDEPVVFTVSKLILRKGLGVVVRALPRITGRHPDCRYVVAGEGPEREALLAIAEATGVSERLRLMGRVSEELKQRLFAASDVYVMPSYPGEDGEVEGFGIAFLEANLHGLPAVGTTCGGIPEAVVDGETGILVEPRRPDQVAEAVCRLLDDRDLRQKMANAGRERIEERFTWRVVSQKISERLRGL